MRSSSPHEQGLPLQGLWRTRLNRCGRTHAQSSRANLRPDDEASEIDEAYWEASIDLGYACWNEDCQFWQGHYGSPRSVEDGEQVKKDALIFGVSCGLDDIAEVVEDTEEE
jgi:hypothetical protein